MRMYKILYRWTGGDVDRSYVRCMLIYWGCLLVKNSFVNISEVNRQCLHSLGTRSEDDFEKVSSTSIHVLMYDGLPLWAAKICQEYVEEMRRSGGVAGPRSCPVERRPEARPSMSEHRKKRQLCMCLKIPCSGHRENSDDIKVEFCRLYKQACQCYSDCWQHPSLPLCISSL